MRLFVLLSLLVLSTSVFPQCSTDSWSSTTGSPLPLGESTVPTGAKYEQSCGLTVDAAGSLPAYVTTDTPLDEPEVKARFYLLADALDINSGDVTVLTGRDVGTNQFELRLRAAGDIKFLVAFYRHNGGLVEHGESWQLQDVWHAIEVAWSAGSGDGTFSLKLDGVEQFALTNVNNSSGVVNQVDLGILNNSDTGGEIAFDAFMLRRSGDPGLLTVNELRNISTRAEVLTIHEIVIGGFVIDGETDKCVVIRGRGPSVGVPEGEVRLSDPSLELKMGQETIASNDNWGDLPEADILTALGLAPPNALEAAVYVCIPPGPYTALVRGTGGVTGIGIVEVFDSDVGTPFLGNISTRARVGTVNLVAIGGFIIDGDQPKQVLIRGRGPSINLPEGVTELANPYLRLVDSLSQTVMENDDWGDADNSDDVVATGLAPPNALEAAILITLDPGAYTAILRGVGGGTGVGIVEVFDQSGGSIAPQ